MANQDARKIPVSQLRERIRQLEGEHKRWMRLAGINRLTNLPNSLMFYRVVLPDELRKFGKRPASLACLLVAPDGIGDINQLHGRVVGDRFIVETAAFLKQQLDQEERLFHLDGANFAILIIGSSEGRARRRATEIKTEFKEITLKAGRQELTDMTCSASVGTIDGTIPKEEVSGTVDQLYQELSDRLYMAKQRGGNTVVGSERKTQA